ncbi:MAG TPA: hypothetical protein VGM88_25635 [Kofleriaceae bacterium]
MPLPTCASLLDRGDRAARRGDAAELAKVALALAGRVGDPHGPALRDLARDCGGGAPDRSAWRELREAIALRISIAGT